MTMLDIPLDRREARRMLTEEPMRGATVEAPSLGKPFGFDEKVGNLTALASGRRVVCPACTGSGLVGDTERGEMVRGCSRCGLTGKIVTTFAVVGVRGMKGNGRGAA